VAIHVYCSDGEIIPCQGPFKNIYKIQYYWNKRRGPY